MLRNRQARNKTVAHLEALEGRQLMAFDTFLHLGNAVPAPSNGHESAGKMSSAWVEIYSFNWGASNPVSVGLGNPGAPTSFNVMQKADASGHALFSTAATGQHFKDAEVVMRKASGDGKAASFLEYDFTDVTVKSIQWSGSSGGDDTPTESVSFGFAMVAISHDPQPEIDIPVLVNSKAKATTL